MKLVASDEHDGLNKFILECLPLARWQRCYVHLLRIDLGKLPRMAGDDCLMELHWLNERRNVEEARRDFGSGWRKPFAELEKLSSARITRMNSAVRHWSAPYLRNTLVRFAPFFRPQHPRVCIATDPWTAIRAQSRSATVGNGELLERIHHQDAFIP